MGSQTLALLTTKENLFWTKQTDLSHRSWSAATQCLLLHLRPIPPPVVLDRFEAFPGKQSPQVEAYQQQEPLLQGSPLSSLLLLLLLLLVHCNSQILFDVVSRTVVVVAVTKQSQWLWNYRAIHLPVSCFSVHQCDNYDKKKNPKKSTNNHCQDLY